MLGGGMRCSSEFQRCIRLCEFCAAHRRCVVYLQEKYNPLTTDVRHVMRLVNEANFRIYSLELLLISTSVKV